MIHVSENSVRELSAEFAAKTGRIDGMLALLTTPQLKQIRTDDLMGAIQGGEIRAVTSEVRISRDLAGLRDRSVCRRIATDTQGYAAI
ncbi:MAG TPA: hypothetical protein VFX85_05875 [Solirubrobacterales bacterium]|nr:hypothetical protein [Solirubrobacterales bacterium]